MNEDDIRDLVTAPSHPKCGALKKSASREGRVEYCAHRAGHNTDHLGAGRCYLHGGRNAHGENHYNYKGGLRTNITLDKIKSLSDEYVKDEDVYNFRELIAVMKAIATVALNGDDLDRAVAQMMNITKAIERLQAVEQGRKYSINIKDLDKVLEQI